MLTWFVRYCLNNLGDHCRKVLACHSLIGMRKVAWMNVLEDQQHQCDQIWQIHHFGGILKSLWQFIDFFCKNVPSLAKATCYWANFHRNKWPNIEKLISPSGHTEFSSQPLGTTKVDASRESKSLSLSINWTFTFLIWLQNLPTVVSTHFPETRLPKKRFCSFQILLWKEFA